MPGPEEAQNVRAVSSHWEEGRKDVTINVRSFVLTADHPVEQRGTDLGPTPVELLLSSLAGCLTGVMVRMARIMTIPLKKVDLKVTGVWGKREYEGIKSINIHVKIEPPLQDQTKLKRLIEQAKRNCTVSNTLSYPPEISFSTEIES